MSPQESGIIRVPFSMLDAMFHKAGLLISRGQQPMVTAPGANANPQRLVENESAPASPYIVTSKSSKRGALYECSANCIPFAAYGLCSQVLAIAELNNKLEDFIMWYKKQKQSHGTGGDGLAVKSGHQKIHSDAYSKGGQKHQ